MKKVFIKFYSRTLVLLLFIVQLLLKNFYDRTLWKRGNHPQSIARQY